MEEHRSCAWMSGPADATVKVSPAKWWFAISRDLFAKSYRSQRLAERTPSICNRTPKFVSPLQK